MDNGDMPRGLNNLLLTKTACNVLSLMGLEKQTITDTKPPFTISPDDEIWRDLFKIFETTFVKPIRFYNKALTAAIDLLFKVCSKPYSICEEFTKNILNQLNKIQMDSGMKELDRFLIIRLVHIFGEMALKLLNFLDETVYKELKRRHYVREERKEEKKVGNGKKKSKKKQIAESASASSSRIANSSTLNESTRTTATVSANDKMKYVFVYLEFSAEILLPLFLNKIFKKRYTFNV